METENSINIFIKTFYPELEFKIHAQYDSHWMCDLPHRWRYTIEIINFEGNMIYNPQDFTPICKLTNGQTVDFDTIYDKMDTFIPHISDKITFFYMTDKGYIKNLERITHYSSGTTFMNEYLVG